VAEVVLRGYLMPDTQQSVGIDLTARERQILKLIAEGHPNKEIASILSISVKTVETHRARLMEKLNFHSVTDLVRYAIRNKLIEPWCGSAIPEEAEAGWRPIPCYRSDDPAWWNLEDPEVTSNEQIIDFAIFCSEY
jgi:DNA-binding CsgD family transcriptional regulator